MKVSEFDYDLREELIAQHPADRRDHARLLVLHRTSGALEHRRFDDLVRLLDPRDLLVLNDTRVIPARLTGRKASGGRIELFLVEPETGGNVWSCLLRASRKPEPGAWIELDGGLRASVLERTATGFRVQLEAPEGSSVAEAIERSGTLPLPPYIAREHGAADDEDLERYQTVYARRPGAVAAPTAGLHFTDELLERLRAAGIELAFLTLHVGPGSFLPVRVDDVAQHRVPAERFEVGEAVVAAIDRARRRGGRVVAVGTTAVRALETAADDDGRVRPMQGQCELFVYPGYRFRVVDALITNFHLPCTSLLMLVCALAGTSRVLDAYRVAMSNDYRFYSYGDAMLVTDR